MSRSIAKSLNIASEAGKQLGNSFLELVLPPVCRLCNQPIPGGDFCRTCDLELTRSEPMMASACHRCGIPKPRLVGQPVDHQPPSDGPRSIIGPLSTIGLQPSKGPCGSDSLVLAPCVHCKKLEFQFDGVVTLWSYQDRVCEAVVAAKYAHQTPLADALGRRLSLRVADRFGEPGDRIGEPGDRVGEPGTDVATLPELVTYVPSHVTRQFVRGGNGNDTIARAVAKGIGRPCHPLLKMTRRIEKQAWLNDRQRLENVRGAFSLKKSYAFPRLPGIANRHILLVDDVLTTGATANEVARMLHDGGAGRVTLAVVARALRT